MNTDIAAFYALFEKEPGDFAAYGACADELDQEGWNALAHAYRWLASRRVFPHRRERYLSRNGLTGRAVPRTARWAWYDVRGYSPSNVIKHVSPNAPRENHSLPWPIMTGEQKTFGTHGDAVGWLADRLTMLAGVYQVEPPTIFDKEAMGDA